MDQDIIDTSLDLQAFLEDLMNVNENKEIEFKSAKGGFPGSFWETYSSFANSEGGLILFGIAEKKGALRPVPLTSEEVTKFVKEFFNTQNNRQKVSVPLLSDKDVFRIPRDGGFVLVFRIPRASRQQRPVYIGHDPMTGTYRRNNEGDYVCDPTVPSQMFAERDATIGKVESRVLNNYTWDDIDMNSFRQYRTMFAYLTPSHPWTALSDIDLMKKLGGYRKDRENGKEGFTMAGLLMFGKAEAITDPECAPDFMVDYREIPSDTTTIRWVDRLYPDGTWEANLFQFYRLVLPKLHQFLPKPFRLVGDTRQDESPAHVAVREALINCLVHASYGGSRRININKTPKGILMSNPGTMLVSVQQYYEGGKSESRNPALQKMFGLIGKSDKAGSGVDKILQGWRDANWRRPYIEEISRPDKVELFLPMESLISNELTEYLKDIFGDVVLDLNHNELSILAAVAENETVTNKSLQRVLELHPYDITKLLKHLCEEGMLLANGVGRGTSYQLNINYDASSDDASSNGTSSGVPSSDDTSSDDTSSDGTRLEMPSCHDTSSNTSSNDASSNDTSSNDASSNDTSSNDTSSNDTSSNDTSSNDTSSDVTSSDCLKRNTPSNEEIRMIKDFCYRWRNISDISMAIGRSRQYTRQRIIPKLIMLGFLEMEFPNIPTHPGQRYRMTSNTNTNTNNI